MQDGLWGLTTAMTVLRICLFVCLFCFVLFCFLCVYFSVVVVAVCLFFVLFCLFVFAAFCLFVCSGRNFDFSGGPTEAELF